MRYGHARILVFPLVVGRLADAVLAAGLADLGSQLHLLEDGDNLAFTESAFLHVGTPSYHGILYHRLAQVFEEATAITEAARTMLT